ncbi:MAG: Stk1 family PASTA domain-containing Ser/Thr kinase [Firmicutes bacterium]|jgi:serine/threonine-protein kinase|nr:Stk1 family PASTA domain-containing Ser/Thr kinase [Bacillota bacterium]MDH7496505.1 Stk1 family PASTA domain-containing Ser/Thr kinase [Bacillota bacterium]
MTEEVLGRRYTILSRVGEGGMAEVYRARDSVLNRIVAIKVLRPQFASDEEFIERFRREAQAAASLSHPNIVSIYDVGHDGDRYYIVMEYVSGKSLKDLIREQGPLRPERAAWIASQILAALDHAHKNNIVHRDIKPHNILVTPEGRVKVTDFGIARAKSTSALTETGTIIGTVNYFSPEQARGEAAGVGSDVYSLGVVLYEMLTGRVPFRGDTPIAIALQHLQGTAIPPSELNPRVPADLSRVVMKALEKDPARRYQQAREMMRALEKYSSVPAGEEVEEETAVGAGGKGQGAPEAPTEVFRVPQVTRGGGSKGVDDTLARPAKASHGPGKAILAIIAFTVALLVLAAVAVIRLPEWLYVEEVRVPDFTGKTLDEARIIAEQAGLRLDEPDRRYDDSAPPYSVIAQRPAPYEKVKLNSRVTLVVSIGKEMVEVPDLKGMDLRQALLELERLELKAGSQSEEYSSEIERGRVLSQSPDAGRRVEKGVPVDIVLSAGPQPNVVVVPELVGTTVSEAESMLASAGLVRGDVVEQPREGEDPGIVLSQVPAAGQEVERGTPVNLVVSAGSKEPSSILDAITPVSTIVTILVPPGADQQEVRIRINDYYGERDYYVGMHSPGERVEKEVNAWGRKVRIRVYIAGVLYEDEWVPKG